MRAALFHGPSENVSFWAGAADVTSVTAPYPGMLAWRVSAASAGVPSAYRGRAFVARQTGTFLMVFAVRSPTLGPVPRIQLLDFAAGVAVGAFRVEAAGGGAVTIVPENGTGTVRVAAQYLCDATGWTTLAVAFTGVLALRTYEVRLLPSGVLLSTAPAELTFSMRACVLEGWGFDDRQVEDVLRDGSEHVQSPSGLEDAWVVGTDSVLRCSVRWMPLADEGAGPGVVGVDGVMPGYGFRDFLSTGRAKSLITIVPDLTQSLSVPAYLVEPMSDALEFEDDNTRRCAIRLRSPQRIPAF
jgi:hypothetical protein